MSRALNDKVEVLWTNEVSAQSLNKLTYNEQRIVGMLALKAEVSSWDASLRDRLKNHGLMLSMPHGVFL